RHHNRSTAERRCAAAVCIATEMGRSCVATENDNILDRYTKPIGGDLGETRLLPLPVRRRASNHRHLSGDLYSDAAPFPSPCGHGLGRTKRTNLNVGRKTDPKKPALLPRRLSFLEETSQSRARQRFAGRGLVVPGVVR